VRECPGCKPWRVVKAELSALRVADRGGTGLLSGSPRTTSRPGFVFERFEPERICQDPKDCELWVTRTKPEETLVEVRSDTDVQIVHLSCL
jgi:hypothetical protein